MTMAAPIILLHLAIYQNKKGDDMKKLFIVLVLLSITTFAYAEYTEKVVVDKIEILENGIIQIRYATKVYKDGVEIAKTYQREIAEPDSRVSEIEDERVKSVAQVVWTPEVKAKYKEEKAKRNQ